MILVINWLIERIFSNKLIHKVNKVLGKRIQQIGNWMKVWIANKDCLTLVVISIASHRQLEGIIIKWA